jgi:phosphoribosylanthranilate isomerase
MFSDVIQIAGVQDALEAEVLLSSGVDLIGFPLRLDVHPEDASDTEVSRIIEKLRLRRRATVITYLQSASDVLDLCVAVGAGNVQIHSEIGVDQLLRLRSSRPQLSIIKSLIVRDGRLDELKAFSRRYEPFVDAFILDSFDEDSGASGATGKVHDWSLSSELVKNSRRDVLLAGGLTPENVTDAIHRVRPAGVDVHTGVEGADGRKDPDRVQRFVDAARAAFAALRSDNAARPRAHIPDEELNN